MAAPPPTLLVPGKLEYPKNDKIIPVEFVIDFVRELRKSAKRKDRILVLKASTGSGKSTILPPKLYEAFPDRMIVSTQPRVFNAIDLPNSILPYNKNLKLGENIGYKTGPSKLPPKRGIVFMTVGSFQMQFDIMTAEDICAKIGFVIVDEAHETSIPADLLHYAIKKFIAINYKNPLCPIFIIASATMDPAIFMRYYETNNYISILGFSFQKDVYYLPEATENYVKSAVKSIGEIIARTPDEGDRSDILVFVAGKMESEKIEAELREKLPKVLIVPISRLDINDQSENFFRINAPISKLKVPRKVITITNVGETGITYEYVRHVVDTGFYKSQEYDPIYCYSSLICKPISLFAREQRLGRVGRRYPGDYTGMYSEDLLAEMNNEAYPDIYRQDFAFPLLGLLRDHSEVMELDIVHRPAFASAWRATEKLYLLGFINSARKLTALGECALKFSKRSIEQIKLIFAGYVWGAPIQDLIIIASIFDARKMPRGNSDFSKLCCCELMPVVEIFYNREKNPMSDRKLIEIAEFRDECIFSLAQTGLNPFANRDKQFDSDFRKFRQLDYIKLIKQCIYEALKLNVATWNGEFYQTRTGLDIKKLPKGLSILQEDAVSHFCYAKLSIAFEPTYRRMEITGISILDGFVNHSFF